MTDTVLIITSPTMAVRRWIDSSGVFPYISEHDRLEIPADTALAILKQLGDITTPHTAEVYQAMSRAAAVQGFIKYYNSQWYPVVDGHRIGFGFFSRLMALESFFQNITQEEM